MTTQTPNQGLGIQRVHEGSDGPGSANTPGWPGAVSKADTHREGLAGPVPIVVTRWKCPHCGRSRAHKSATVAHIGRCWENPDSRTCKTCANFFPGGPECITGRPCNCNDAGCGKGHDIEAEFPRTNCDDWDVIM